MITLFSDGTILNNNYLQRKEVNFIQSEIQFIEDVIRAITEIKTVIF